MSINDIPERSIIVDVTDTVIDYKPRKELNPTDIYRVSALQAINEFGEFYLVQRATDKKKDPCCWGPTVSGTHKIGDTYTDCRNRETLEEIGVPYGVPDSKYGVSFGPLGKNRHFVQRPSGSAFWEVELVFMPKRTKFKLQKTETIRGGWYHPEEIAYELKKNPHIFTPVVPYYLDYFYYSNIHANDTDSRSYLDSVIARAPKFLPSPHYLKELQGKQEIDPKRKLLEALFRNTNSVDYEKVFTDWEARFGKFVA
jgi:isopentenyldiphosphate isomerase